MVVFIAWSHLHERQLNKTIITMLILKKVSTWTAASRIALRTSAKFNRSSMDVASTAISVFLAILTLVPSYSATAVITVLVKSHKRCWP